MKKSEQNLELHIDWKKAEILAKGTRIQTIIMKIDVNGKKPVIEQLSIGARKKFIAALNKIKKDYNITKVTASYRYRDEYRNSSEKKSRLIKSAVLEEQIRHHARQQR